MASSTKVAEPMRAGVTSGGRDADGFEWPDLPCAPCYEAYEHDDEEGTGTPAAQSGCLEPAGKPEPRNRR